MTMALIPRPMCLRSCSSSNGIVSRGEEEDEADAADEADEEDMAKGERKEIRTKGGQLSSWCPVCVCVVYVCVYACVCRCVCLCVCLLSGLSVAGLLPFLPWSLELGTWESDAEELAEIHNTARAHSQ